MARIAVSARQDSLAFPALCIASGLGEPVSEFRFAAPRRWRFDYAWPSRRVALEVEGGAWIGGRHTRGAGFVKDLEKYSEAAALGWRIVRVTPRELCSAQTFDWLKRALAA